MFALLVDVSGKMTYGPVRRRRRRRCLLPSGNWRGKNNGGGVYYQAEQVFLGSVAYTSSAKPLNRLLPWA